MFWIWGCNLYYLCVLTYCSILEALRTETSVWAMLMSHLLTKHTPNKVFVVAKAAILICFGMLPFPIQDLNCLMQREFNSGTLCNKNQTAWNFVCPAPEVMWCSVAIIISVVLISPYLCICDVLWQPFITISHAVYVLMEDTNTLLNLKLKCELKVINFLRRAAC